MLQPKSVITFPSGGQRLPDQGSYEITGLAWSGGSAIRKVEVSLDGGKTWKQAAIKGDAHPSAFTQFGLEWNWNGEEALLQSRCTDDRGKVQPTPAQFAKTYNVTVEDMKKGNLGNTHHVNFIYTWRVTPDGSVHNAPFA
jgi:sulfane dehydrogenase subunit SoxC